MIQTCDWPAERALISVSEKSGIVELARDLQDRGIEILSTGGTAQLLREHNIAVVEASQHTGFPEIMDGRVKTLHPKIHGGILGRRNIDAGVMGEHGISPIDLVIVNLYRFEESVADAHCTLDTAIENIDVGGPAMVRAAAKNFAHVTVIVDPKDYGKVIDELERHEGCITYATRYALAVKAFEHTARYDGAIANYLSSVDAAGSRSALPQSLNLQFQKVQDMRYGENPHQAAAFYREPEPPVGGITAARQLQGKALSFNNIADADAALECVKQFEGPACVIVKHGNPCGVAVNASILTAYQRAFRTDPTSAFGGIIAFNRSLDGETAKAIVEQQFVEVVIAPQVTPEARTALQTKPKTRALETGQWENGMDRPPLEFKSVNGGLLAQQRDMKQIAYPDLSVVSRRAPTDSELQDLLFVWKVAKFVKSNAIVYAKNRHTVGIGAGQMSRVYSAKIASIKAADEGLTVHDSVMASDAFFPFRDGIDAAAEAGVRAVIQPGGSVRDGEVIAAADEHGMAMVFTGVRHFRH